MLKLKKLTVFLVVLAGMAGCLESTNNSTWSVSMRGMAQSYEKLVPYMFDSSRYNDPNNQKFITTYLQNLSANASSLNKHTAKGLSGNDPLFNVGIRDLQNIIQKASESYYVESYEYSQNLLQTSLNYCNSCHSRTNLGPTFIQPDSFNSMTAKLSPIDHSRFLVATRQFPKAVLILEEALNTHTWKNEDEKKEALFKYMTIVLKNVELPAKALRTLDNMNKKQLSKKTLKNIKQWKIYLKNWTDGKFVKKEEARNLLKSGNKGSRPAHFIEALHQSIVLHKSLSLEQEKLWRARTYSALGKIYENYPSLGFWTLPSTYYETCVYEAPGTKTALKCYYSLEKWVSSQSNGVQGPSLLKLEEPKLKKLKILASKKSGAPSPSFNGSSGEDW